MHSYTGPPGKLTAGLIAVPGLIDIHQHVCGGGGEAGPASRTPEAKLSELLNAGITTVVGLTGTDSVSRAQVGLATRGSNLHILHTALMHNHANCGRLLCRRTWW